MKKTHLLIALLFTILSYSQPAGYYTNANGTGYTLKTQLKTIITNNHIDHGYGGLWGAYATTDRDNGIGFENDNSIVDIYSENPLGPDPYTYAYATNQCGSYTTEGICYNREHLVPQAYFENVAVNPMKNDPFHVMPVDGKVNGTRDNFPFGIVPIASYTSMNGSKKGFNLNSGYSAGYALTVFEPIDEFKGDIARSLLYFATRYEEQMNAFYLSASVQSKDMFDGSNDNVFSPTFLNILLTWNILDPVSIKETKRNNAIFSYQGNRNPFIDHPEYACAIWSSACAALSLNELQIAKINIYPNPSNNHSITIETDALIDEIQMTIINGQIIKEVRKPVSINGSYVLENLPQGFYFLKLSSDKNSITKKIIVN
jgi:endonuclease I